MLLYYFLAEWLVNLYSIGGELDSIEASQQAGAIAVGLLGYVSLYIIADATQLTMAGILRGAGDTWFVWLAGITASLAALAIGFWFEPVFDAGGVNSGSGHSDFGGVLNWWWRIILIWIWLLATTMTIRYASGAWRQKRMV